MEYVVFPLPFAITYTAHGVVEGISMRWNEPINKCVLSVSSNHSLITQKKKKKNTKDIQTAIIMSDDELEKWMKKYRKKKRKKSERNKETKAYRHKSLNKFSETHKNDWFGIAKMFICVSSSTFPLLEWHGIGVMGERERHPNFRHSTIPLNW